MPGKAHNTRVPTDLYAQVQVRLEELAELYPDDPPTTYTDAVIEGLRRWLVATDPTRSAYDVPIGTEIGTIDQVTLTERLPSQNGPLLIIDDPMGQWPAVLAQHWAAYRAAPTRSGGDDVSDHVAQDVQDPPAASGSDLSVAPSRHRRDPGDCPHWLADLIGSFCTRCGTDLL